MRAVEYYEAHKKQYLDDLIQLCKFPTISFPDYDAKPLKDCASFIKDQFTSRGIEDVHIIQQDDSHPYVLAHVGHDPNKPTLLMYSHYDVQPIGEESKWVSPAFEPTIRDNRLYGRGTADDKAGFQIQFAAMDAFIQSKNELPVNLKFVIEGEEEIGSVHLEKFIGKHKKPLEACDAIIVTDTGNIESGLPCITTMLRGMVITEVELRILHTSLHSGLWGGSIPDAAMALSKMLGTLVDDQGRIAIPGMLDKVTKPSPQQLSALDKLPINKDTFRKQAGMTTEGKLIQTDKHFLENSWYVPSLVVNAIQASSREKAGNILCDHAWSRVGIRIVPDMDPQETLDQLTEHMKKHTPWGCEVTFKSDTLVEPWGTDVSQPIFQKTQEAMSEGYGKEALFIGCGGSIPIVKPMSKELGNIPAVLIGIEDPYSLAHGENESMNLADMESSTRSLIFLFEKLGK